MANIIGIRQISANRTTNNEKATAVLVVAFLPLVDEAFYKYLPPLVDSLVAVSR